MAKAKFYFSHSWKPNFINFNYMHLDSGLVTTVSVIMSCPVIRCYIDIPLAPLALDADVTVLTWPLVVTQTKGCQRKNGCGSLCA